MADLVSEGGEFSCNFCASKLKLSVITSSSTGDSQKLANQMNCFLPPPGGNCTLIPGIPPPPCVGAPPGMVVETGQTTVKVDGQTALGDGCKFMCPLGQPVSLSKAGQEVAKHDEATISTGAFIVGGTLIVGGAALAIFLLPEEVVGAAVAGTYAVAKVAAKVGKNALKKVAAQAKKASKTKPKNPPKNDASNAAKAAKHKQDLRRQMSKPEVKDPELKKIMDKTYRENAKVGSGSTAEAIRVEKATGEMVGGKYHTQKGQDTLNELAKWIKKNQNNPSVSSGDFKVAENVFTDIADALKL